MATGKEKKFDKMSNEKKLKFIRGLDNPQKIRFLQRIQDPKERDAIAAQIPGFESWWEANKHMPGGGRKGGVFHGATEGSYNIPTTLPTQEEYRKLALSESQKGLPELLERLRTPYSHPMMNQMEEMFGHLQNPILQNLLRPEARHQARGALLPSEIEQEYQQYQQAQPSALGGLLGALGNQAYRQQVVPWLQNPENLQQLYGYAEEGLPQAYNYAMESRPAQALQNFYESTPGHFLRGAASGIAHGPSAAYETAQAFGSLGKEGLQSLLSKLGSYIPSRKKQ